MDLDKSKLQCIMNAVDENIFFKDTEGRYVLATHVCNMLNSTGDSDFSIYGKTDLEVQPDQILGRRFYQEDMNIIKSGESIKYIQKMQFGDAIFYYEISKSPVFDNNGKIMGIVGIIKDITSMITLQEKLERYSITDMMTQTFNRSYYESQKFKEGIQYPVGVVMADINNLKYYNDNYGHRVGDILIKTIVNNIQQFMKQEDRLIRLGGDEFLLLLPGCDTVQSVGIVNNIKDAEKNIKLKDIAVSASYGVAIAESESDFDIAIGEADKIMYANKRKWKECL